MNLRSLLPLLLFGLSFTLSSASYAGRLKQILEQGRADERPCLETLEAAPTPLSLRTNRFTLKVVGLGEFAAVREVWGNADVAAVSGDLMSDGQIRGLLQIGHSGFGDFRRGAIVNLGIFDGERLIGMSQLAATSPDVPVEKGVASYDQTWAEISYHLHPDYWSVNGKYRGVASEVAAALVQQAVELGVDGIHAQAIASNVGSQKVLLNAGLVEIDRRLSGSDGGSVYFAVRRTEYEAKRGTSRDGGAVTSTPPPRPRVPTRPAPAPMPVRRPIADTPPPREPVVLPRTQVASGSSAVSRQFALQGPGQVTFTVNLEVRLGTPVLVSPAQVRSRLGDYPTDGAVGALVASRFDRVGLGRDGVSKLDAGARPWGDSPVVGKLAYLYRDPGNRPVGWGIVTVTEFYRLGDGTLVVEMYDELTKQHYQLQSRNSPQFYLEQ